MISGIEGTRIDTHLHAIPPAYKQALEAAGGDPTGYPTPKWSVDAALSSMSEIGTTLGILSVTYPGVPIAGVGEKARQLARTLNEDLASYINGNSHLGFFGTLPDWQDIEGTLAELEYLYETQKLCAGVTVYTTYGSKLLGDATFIPIWEKLQSYKALVFIHPGALDIKPALIGSFLPQPIVDFPLATTRTAVDLVMTKTLRSYPDVDIILSHAGGALPFIGGRTIGSLEISQIAARSGVNLVQAQEDFARFYYDIALSASAAQLDGLIDFAHPSHILFGSDFPYAPQFAVDSVVLQYATYVSTNVRGHMVAPEVLRANAIALLNKHSQGRVYA